MLLSSENEIIIRREIAFQLRYFCKELDENYIKKNIFRIVDNYFNDEDLIIKFLVFESVILNLGKFNEDIFIQNIIDKIHLVFESKTSENFEFQVKIMNSIFDECFKEKNYGKHFLNLSKFFFKVKAKY